MFKLFTDKLALAVSTVLSPFIVFGALISWLIYREAGNVSGFYYWSSVTLLIMACLPTVYILNQVRLGKITDIHIIQREQRAIVFLVVICSLIIGTAVLWKLGAPHLFLVLSMITFLNALVAGMITLFWKISMHSWVLAGALSIMWLVTRLNIWFLIAGLLVPLMIWSRVSRQRHTLAQAVMGALAGGATTLVIYIYFLH